MCYRIVAEQVSHHPPVSAFHAEAEQWLFHGSIHPRLKFWGKSVEIQPKGTLTLEILRLVIRQITVVAFKISKFNFSEFFIVSKL